MRTITTTDRSQSAKPTAPKREGNVLSNQQITYRVGSFTTIAAIVLLYGWGWLHSLSLFHPPQRFKVKFHDIAGLNKNAPVNINGVRVGTVETVVLQPPHGEDPRACVLIGLKINTENVQIPHGSEFTIQTLGLVGAKYVEITLPEKAADPNDAIRKEEVIVGEDPVRVELVVNKIATNLASIDYSGVEHEFAQKLERVAKAADGVEDATHRIGKVADEAQGAARNANAFFARGKDSFPKLETTATHMTALTDDLRVSSRKFNKILDNPAMSSDLKETATQARIAAENIKAAMNQLNKTVSDKETRGDILRGLDSLNKSTSNIANSVQVVQKLANNGELRSDLKETVNNAKLAMQKFNTTVNDLNFKDKLGDTMDEVNAAAIKLNIVSDQLNQMLGKSLIHSMFRSTGKMSKADAQRLKDLEKRQAERLKKTQKEVKELKSQTDANLKDSTAKPSTPDATPAPAAGDSMAAPVPAAGEEQQK